ncbi:hypothetical protein D3C85_1599080 [compost metagenome]
MKTGGIERAVDLGGELAITQERGDTGPLGFRAAETELPLVTRAIGDFLFAT